VGCMTDEPKLKTNVWFAFYPSAQGNGYATEAVRALIGSMTIEIPLEIECDPRNTGSWKLAERLGFHKTHCEENSFECKGEWVGSVVYTLLPITES
jgi:RimJ/RimL family protein N-acetyltransferase